MEIQKDVKKQSYDLTRRWNTVAVVTDGTAVLGLGDIGPEKQVCLLWKVNVYSLKEFGGVDAIPLCVRSKDVDEIVKTVSLWRKDHFGGINLGIFPHQDALKSKRTEECCDIPMFMTID